MWSNPLVEQAFLPATPAIREARRPAHVCVDLALKGRAFRRAARHPTLKIPEGASAREGSRFGRPAAYRSRSLGNLEAVPQGQYSDCCGLVFT
jgi:hypothetical protein